MTTTATPRDAAELAVLVPYQLGYHPGPCVILAVMNGRRIGLMQRHDLLEDPWTCQVSAERAVAISVREGATALLLIAFEEDEGGSRSLREAMAAAAVGAGLSVREHLVVREGRCYSPSCEDTCCSHGGRVLPRPEDVPAVAPFVQAGVFPLPSRDHVVDEVLPRRDEVRADAVAHCAQTLSQQMEEAEIGLTWARVLDPDLGAPEVASLTDAEVALLGLSLLDIAWRDALLTVLCPGALPSDDLDETHSALARVAAAWCPWVLGGLDAPDDVTLTGEVPDARDHHDDVLAVRDRLVELTRILPSELSPPVLTCVAHLAWWAGDGTVTSICLERALEIDPDYRLADLMMQLLSAGVRPWSMGEAAA